MKKIFFLWIIFLGILSVQKMAGAKEISFFSYDYQGAIDGRPLQLQLRIIGDSAEGNFCYQPCKTRNVSGMNFWLQGKKNRDAWLLDERDDKDGKPSGTWEISVSAEGDMVGERTSVDKTIRNKIILKSSRPTFPYVIKIMSYNEDDEQNDRPCNIRIAALEIFNHQKLMQKINISSERENDECPIVQDYNFDGFRDIALSRESGVGANTIYDLWIYSPLAKKFIKTPVLDNISNPQIDTKRKLIYAHWRSSSSTHGAAVYKWEGKKLKRIRYADTTEKSSTNQNGETVFCRSDPLYSVDTGKFEWYSYCK